MNKENNVDNQINKIMDALYSHGNKNGVTCLYDIFKDENIYSILKEYLHLPDIRIIDDKIFIKTHDYQSDGINRFKRFFIILDKNGEVLPSYDNQFVEINPSFIILCGSYKNQIISEDELEIIYCTHLDKIELDKYIGDQTKYELKISNDAFKHIFTKVHDYASSFSW